MSLRFGGQAGPLLCRSAEEASKARTCGCKGRKGFACLRCVLSPLGDGRALSNFFLHLYVRFRRVQEKEA